MRWLGQSYGKAKKMPADMTMKYFMENFLGEIKLISSMFHVDAPITKNNIAIPTCEIPKEWRRE